jgi:ATP-dependent RNA helicase RhlE
LNYSSSARTRKPSSFGKKSYQGGGGNRNGGGRRKTGSGHGQYIDPKKFVKAAKPVEQDAYEATHKFEDFALNELVMKNVLAKGFKAPSQVQDQAIIPGLEGKDVIGIANTGTGKTAAFMLPLLTKLLAEKRNRALIIAPTRELAIQIQEEGRAYAKGGRLFDVLLIGGAPIGRQLRDLQRRPEIIIGTPGRIKDHLERGSLKVDQVSTIVLDEVDRMLDMGFIDDIRNILSGLPQERQSLFFSATMEPRIENLIKTFTKDPITVMARTSDTSDNVEQTIQHYFEKTDKIQKLHDLLISEGTEKTLIFCETKHGSDKLQKELQIRGFKVEAIHGNKSQGQRQRALQNFKQNKVDILVATDVAARGLDIDNVSHVINYDVPHTWEDYTHRIGRTGRGGKTGTSVTFVTH